MEGKEKGETVKKEKERRRKGREGTLCASELSYGTRSTYQQRVIALFPHLFIPPLHEILKQYSGCVHRLVGQLHEGNTELDVPTTQHSIQYHNNVMYSIP